ncbi:MAG TPA: carbohydrate binding domain-containing protein [Pirellulales bacterium]|jgi:flagellin|nr:carbohydrate binding domain-containing protein [Pirellulales bacterium]
MEAVVRFAATLVAIAVAFFGAGSALASNLVDNPGFETGDLTDWTRSGNTTYITVVNYTPYVHSGDYGLQFSGTSADGGAGILSQTLATDPGQDYVVDFWLYSPGGGNGFSVTFDGNTLFSEIDVPAAMPTPAYTEYTFTSTAKNSSALLQFSAYDNPGFFGLDDVSVTLVPEPSAVVLLALGAMGIASAAIRRRVRRGRLA